MGGFIQESTIDKKTGLRVASNNERNQLVNLEKMIVQSDARFGDNESENRENPGKVCTYKREFC